MIKEHADGYARLREGLDILESVSEGFRMAGMTGTWAKLDEALHHINSGAQGMDCAFSTTLHERCVDSQRASDNMIRAVLASHGTDINPPGAE